MADLAHDVAASGAVRARAPGDPSVHQRDAILPFRARRPPPPQHLPRRRLSPHRGRCRGRHSGPADGRPHRSPRQARPSAAAARPDSPTARHHHAPEDTLAERLITTQCAAAADEHARIRIEVDGRVVEGLEGQTILEVCRDNGIEIPTLCYEPKLPGFGACRMCVVEVEGEDQPADLVLARRRGGHGRPDPDRGDAPAAPDEPRADLLRPQRVLPAAVPEQVPEPHRHPGLPQGQRRGELARVDPDLQAHDPVPQRARPRVPRPVRGALPPRRGGRGDRDPRQPPLRGRPGHQGDARRGRRPAAAVRAAGGVRAAARPSSAPAPPAWPRPTTCCSTATT